jgi:magnesium transporter
MPEDRPTPASRSDARSEPISEGRLDAPVIVRHGVVVADGPGRVRVFASTDGATTALTGDAAIAALPDLIKAPKTSVWVDLEGVSREQVETIGRALSLHPLIVEDVLEGNQRAKIETTDGLVHIVIFHLAYETEVVASEVDAVLGDGFLLTAHESNWDPVASTHLRSGVEPILKRGPDHLLWALADDIVDGYFPFADRMGDAIDEVQDDVIRKATPETLERLFVLKRELIDVRRAVSPIREVFNQLTNRDTPLIDPDEVIYFRDIYDHVIRLTDELDNYRELASATLDVYLTTINNNLSIIMKRLTGVTVIIAGIGAIAGIFGMSEAGTALGGAEAGGFWLVTAITVGIAALAAVVLRKIDWI